MDSGLQIETSFDKKFIDDCNRQCLTTNTLNFLTPKEITCFSEYVPSYNLGAQKESAETEFIHTTVCLHKKASPFQENEKKSFHLF